jgi:hypothetical protein
MLCGEIDETRGTKILVAPVWPAKLVQGQDRYGRIRTFKKAVGTPMQLVIYSNTVRMRRNPVDIDGRSKTAMVLPFPVQCGKPNRFKLFALEYSDVFDDLDILFDIESSDVPSLAVKQVGSYDCKVCANLADLAKLDLHRDLYSSAKRYYPKGFGFVVCVLRQGASYHPIAYCHELLSGGRLFIPLRRHLTSNNKSKDPVLDRESLGSIGSGENQLTDYYSDVIGVDSQTLEVDDYVLRFQSRAINDPASDALDHSVYIVNRPDTGNKKYPGAVLKELNTKRLETITGYINFNRMPREITFGSIRSIQRLYLGRQYYDRSDIYW